MAYNQKLAERIRERLAETQKVKEKEMMGGLTFMGIIKDEMMCRIDPDMQEVALSKIGCRIMDFTGRPMKGYVMVDEIGTKSKKDFDYWIGLCLEFNKKAKSSKKK